MVLITFDNNFHYLSFFLSMLTELRGQCFMANKDGPLLFCDLSHCHRCYKTLLCNVCER